MSISYLMVAVGLPAHATDQFVPAAPWDQMLVWKDAATELHTNKRSSERQSVPLADPDTAPPRLLERLRDAIRVRHCSISTDDAYAGWVRRLIINHGTPHPLELGAAEVGALLTHWR